MEVVRALKATYCGGAEAVKCPHGAKYANEEARLKRAFGDYYHSEEVLAPAETQLGEGYFAAILLPPAD